MAPKLRILLLLVVIPVWLPADQGHDHGPAIGEVGSVSFPVSCSPAAQKVFSRSVAMLHSFWYEEAAPSLPSLTPIPLVPWHGGAWP